MLYLDLDEVDKVLNQSAFWSTSRWGLARFQAKDFYFGQHGNMADNVREYVFQKTGKQLTGPIRLLTNLRYFGFIFNPICCYYCFDENDENPEAIVAEVSNTPWLQKHPYVLTCDANSRSQHVEFTKDFHVSPFMPMDMDYQWHSKTPGKRLSLHLENHQNGSRVFDATLAMEANEVTASALNKLLVQYPFMTFKIVLAIYWQALKLFAKKIPFHHHPKSILEQS